RGAATGYANLAPIAGINRTQRRNANGIAVTRLTLRRANVSEESRFYFDCCTHARVRHWREHGAFQHRQHSAASSAAVPPAGSPGLCLDDSPVQRRVRRILRGLPRLAGTKPDV